MGDNIPLTGSDGDGSLSFYDVAIDLENCNMSSTLLDTDANQWCISCRNLKQTIDKMRDDYEANYKMLKEKIISTNDLIKRYKAKCDEYDATSKKLVDTERKLANTIRAKDGMMVHLKEAMDEHLPVKELNAELERKVKWQEISIEGLQDKASAVLTLQTQLNALKKLSEIDKRKFLADCAEMKLESKKVLVSQKKSEEKVTKSLDTMKTLKQQLSDALKENRKLATKNEKLQNKLPGKQSATNRKGVVKPVAPDNSSGKGRLMSPPMCGMETSDDESLDVIFAEVGIVGRQRWSGGWTPVSPLPSSPASSLGSMETESSDEELGNEVARLFERGGEGTSILPVDTMGDRLSDSDSDSSDDASTEVPFRCDGSSVQQPVAVFEASPVKVAAGKVIRPIVVKGNISPTVVKGNNDIQSTVVNGNNDIHPAVVKGNIQPTVVEGNVCPTVVKSNNDIYPTIVKGRSRKQAFTNEGPGLCSTASVEDEASSCASQQRLSEGRQAKMADKDVNVETVTVVKRDVLATVVDRLKQTRSISSDMLEYSIGTPVQTHSIESVERSIDTIELSTDAVKHPTDTVEHSTDTVEHSIDTVEHSTDSLEHSTDTVEHSIDTVEHPTDTVEHSTDTVEHSIDTVEHSTDTMEHSTDTVEHSIDTVEHSTDTVEHSIDTVEHSTDTLEHSIDTVEHSTDTLEHSTDTVELSTNTVEHSTDIVEHPTDAVEHPTDTVEHSVDIAEHSVDTVEHPTDTVEHPTATVEHSVDTVEYSVDTVEHSVDTMDHSTDTVEHSVDTVEHSVDTVEHSVDTAEHSTDTVEHSTDTVEHSVDTVEHSVDTVEHPTDTVEHSVDTVEHPTNTVEHSVDTAEHSTDTVEHSTETVEHSTSAVEHSVDTVEHPTDTVEHSTDTVEHSVDAAEHSTDTVEHSVETVEHSTDTVEHPTDTVEHSVDMVEHSTDTAEHSTHTVEHSTHTVECLDDTLEETQSIDMVDHSTDTVEHSIDTVEHSTDTVERSNDTLEKTQSTDTLEHSTDAVEHSTGTAEHSNDTVEHSTDAVEHSTDTLKHVHSVGTVEHSVKRMPSSITLKHLHQVDAMKHSPDVRDSSYRVKTTVHSSSEIPKLDTGDIVERHRTKLVVRGSVANAKDRDSAISRGVQEVSSNVACMNNHPTVNFTAVSSHPSDGSVTVTDKTKTDPNPSSITPVLPQVSPSKRRMPPPMMPLKRHKLTRVAHVKNMTPPRVTPPKTPVCKQPVDPVNPPQRHKLTRVAHVKNQAQPRATPPETPICIQPVERATKLLKSKVAPASVSSEKLSINESRVSLKRSSEQIVCEQPVDLTSKVPKSRVTPASVQSERLSINESCVSLKRSSEQTEALDLSCKPKTVTSAVKDADTTTATYKLHQRVTPLPNVRTAANDVSTVSASTILAPVAIKKRRLRAPLTLDDVSNWLNPLLGLPKPPVSPLPLSPVKGDASSARQFFPDLNDHVLVKTQTETAASKAEDKKRKKAGKKARKQAKAQSCSGDNVTNMHAVNNVLSKAGAKQTAAGRKAINIELELLLRGNVKPAVTASNISRAQPAIQPDVFIDCVTNILYASKVDMLPVVYTCCRSQPQKLKQPFLAPDEHKLLGLLLQLDEQACFVNILEVLLLKILSILRINDNTLIGGRTALCRLFTAVCRIKGDVSRVRILAYDTVRRGFNEFPLMTLAIAGVWPEVLRPEEGKETCVLRCLRYAIYKSLQESKERHHQLSQCLTALCGWPPWAADRPDEATVLARLAMDTLLQSSDEDHLYDAAKALELLSAKEGWHWTNNHLIIKLIWPVLQQWLAGGQHSFSDSAVGTLLRVLGVVTYSCPSQHASAAHEVIQTLQALLSQSTNVCDTIQEALLEALMLLAPFKPDVSAQACHTWVKQRHKKQPLRDGVKTKIRDFVEHYKCRFKYLSQLMKML